MQLYLAFLDIPVPEACVWERLSEEQKSTVIQMLSRLMLKASANGGKETSDDRHQQG